MISHIEHIHAANPTRSHIDHIHTANLTRSLKQFVKKQQGKISEKSN